MEKEKTIKITNVKQFECLVQCMEQNVQVAKGYFNFGSTKFEFNNAWNSCAEKLNSLGPPIRDGSGWQKVWTDFKGKLKKKLAHNKKEITATGGGACRLHTFSPLEETVIKILSLNRIFPNSTGKTFGLSAVPSTSSSRPSTSNTEQSTSPILLHTTSPDNELSATEDRITGSLSIDLIEDHEEPPANSHNKSNQRKSGQKKNLQRSSEEKYRLLETQTKHMEETLKYVKESARYSRKIFELKQKRLNIWQQHLLSVEKNNKEKISIKLRQLEYKEKKLAYEESRY